MSEPLICHVNPLAIRKRLGRDEWMPPKPYGNGWWFDTYDPDNYWRILVSSSTEADGHEWIHASISCSDRGMMPTYAALKLMHQAVFGDRYAFQVFAPQAKHINITENVLHLWGRADGANVLPDFARFGTI